MILLTLVLSLLLNGEPAITVTPAELSLDPGRAARVDLSFDPIDDSGSVEKDIIIRTTLEQMPKALYLVHGEVIGEEPAEETVKTEPPSQEAADQQGGMPVDFYATPGCRSCQRLLQRTLPKLERRTGVSLAVKEHGILDPEEYAVYLLQIGLFFSAAVFITCLLIGLGFFQALRLSAAFPVMAVVIRWLLIAVLLVFALSYWGVSSQKLTGWFQRGMKTVKLLLAALFFGLAVLTLIT